MRRLLIGGSCILLITAALVWATTSRAEPRKWKDATGKFEGTFRIASRNDKSWPHPVIASGKLFLRDQD